MKHTPTGTSGRTWAVKAEGLSKLRVSIDLMARTAIWLAVVALWVSLTKPDDVELVPKWTGVPTVLGGVLILAGLGLYATGALSLAQAKRDSLGTPDRLLTNGPYGYVRNPVYLAVALVVVGLSFLYHAWQLSAVLKTAILFTVAHLAVVFLEEPATRKRFEADYDDYCRSVPRWVPRWRLDHL